MTSPLPGSSTTLEPSSPSPAFRAADRPAALLALAAETGILWLILPGQLSLAMALVCHVVVLAGLCLRMAQSQRAGRDTGAALLLIPAVAITGPFGALGGLLVGWLSRQGVEDQDRLQRWYGRIALSTETSPMSRLSDHIMSGRALDPRLAPPTPFAALIVTGTIAEKQSILGLIARKFHPEYLPALQVALISDEPVIRVQAAAVAAKIRGDLAGLVDRLLTEAASAETSPDALVRATHEARLCAQSGLMEDKDKVRTERLIEELLARTVAQFERASAGSLLSAEATWAINMHEDHLLAMGRLGAFRQARRKRIWAARGPWRWRRLQPGKLSQSQSLRLQTVGRKVS